MKFIEDAAGRSSAEQASLHFAVANLLDQLGRYDEAFANAARASFALRAFDMIGPWWNGWPTARSNISIEKPSANWRGRRSASRRAFIVGMARSGTSLIEQILASHPAVYGGGESDRVFRLWESVVRRLSQPNLPMHHSLDQLTTDIANALATEFLAPLRELAPAASRVTDKTPSNAVHLGLIARSSRMPDSFTAGATPWTPAFRAT